MRDEDLAGSVHGIGKSNEDGLKLAVNLSRLDFINNPSHSELIHGNVTAATAKYQIPYPPGRWYRAQTSHPLHDHHETPLRSIYRLYPEDRSSTSVSVARLRAPLIDV